MIQLLIIADDLTGAIDTGVQLAKQGVQTKVIPDPDCSYKDLFNSDESPVLVINTESRHINLNEAAIRIDKVMSLAQAAGIKHYYKKTDSTMRGNIGAELEAFKSNINQKFIGFIPAHPKLKRFTRGGKHYIGETPLHQTTFGSDPLEPITQSDIREILLNQTNIKISSVEIKQDPEIQPADILIFDCQKLNDLSQIAKYLQSRNCVNAIAGSAAMVELLPELFKLEKKNPVATELHRPALLINGSLNEISRDQVRYASERGINTYLIPPYWFDGSATREKLEKDDIFSAVISELINNQHVILSSSEIFSEKFEPVMSNLNYNQIPRRLGMIVQSIIQKTNLSTLVVFGGDTLMGIIEMMDSKYMEPQTEIMPGVALSLIKMNDTNMNVITKPGGYGEKDVITKIFSYLNELS